MNTIQLIELILTMLQAGGKIFAQVEQAAALVRKLQAENRDATPEEWNAINADFDKATADLASAIAAARLPAAPASTSPPTS